MSSRAEAGDAFTSAPPFHAEAIAGPPGPHPRASSYLDGYLRNATRVEDAAREGFVGRVERDVGRRGRTLRWGMPIGRDRWEPASSRRRCSGKRSALSSRGRSSSEIRRARCRLRIWRGPCVRRPWHWRRRRSLQGGHQKRRRLVLLQDALGNRPDLRGGAVITGKQIGRDTELRFNPGARFPGPERLRLRFPPDAARRWRYGLSDTLIRAPGCYAFHVAGQGFAGHGDSAPTSTNAGSAICASPPSSNLTNHRPTPPRRNRNRGRVSISPTPGGRVAPAGALSAVRWLRSRRASWPYAGCSLPVARPTRSGQGAACPHGTPE